MATAAAEERPAVVGQETTQETVQTSAHVMTPAMLEAARDGISCPRGNDPVLKVAISADEMTDLLTSSYVRACADKGVDASVGERGLMRRIGLVAKWLTDPTTKPFLLMCGGYGNGKTTMTRAIGGVLEGLRRISYRCYSLAENEEGGETLEAIRRSVPDFAFLTATELCNMAENDVDRFMAARAMQMLALDDVGCEPRTIKRYGTESSPFVEVVYHRYERMLPTVITSNLNMKGLHEMYGPRVGDRLVEVCNVLEFKNTSYRR